MCAARGAEHPYHLAQQGLTQLKVAVHALLESAPPEGLTNAELGRTLGIYAGHLGHEGHIPRTLLSIMQQEGAVEQDEDTLRWRIRDHAPSGA